MRFWLDSADIKEVAKWRPIISGVTTNPTLLLRAGVKDRRKVVVDIAKCVEKLPVSVQVNEMSNCDYMFEEALYISSWADNIVVKVPIATVEGWPCIDVIDRLRGRSIDVNVTACMSWLQAICAMELKANYVSLFWCRMKDAQVNMLYEAKALWNYREELGRFDTEIVTGSIRQVSDLHEVLTVGCTDIITVPPVVLEKVFNNPITRSVVEQFARDAK